jgi:hypothetical protein
MVMRYCGYSVPMTEERAAPHLYSEPDVSEMLDDLIDARHEVAFKHRFVEEYRNTHQPLAKPQTKVFEDAASLTEHTNAHTRYVRGLDEVMEEKTRSEERFEAQVDKIKAILPRDTHVFHSYALRRSDQAERFGRYQITHTPGGLIDIEKVND